MHTDALQNNLQADFRYFLTAIWSHLKLPQPTRAQLCIAEYLQQGPKRLQIQAFRGVGKSWITAAFDTKKRLSHFYINGSEVDARAGIGSHSPWKWEGKLKDYDSKDYHLGFSPSNNAVSAASQIASLVLINSVSCFSIDCWSSFLIVLIL